MLSFYSFVAYVSECIFLCPLVKHVCGPYGSGVALTRTKVLAQREALPEARSAPKFAFQVNRPVPGGGCRSKAWFMAAPGLRVVDGKSSSTLKEAPLWGCLRLSQGRDLNG